MPDIRVNDPSLKHLQLSHFNGLEELTSAYFKAVAQVCIERPLLITQFHRDRGLLTDAPISILDKARAYRYVLEHRTPVVKHQVGYKKSDGDGNGQKPALVEFKIPDCSPFAGSTTSKFRGVPIHPELMGLILWPELGTMRERKTNPFQISDHEAEMLNLEVFPYWMDFSIMERARERYYKGNWRMPGLDDMKLLQNLVFFLTSKPLCISHTIPNFSEAVNRGLAKMVEDTFDEMAKTTDASKIEFCSAVTEVLQGIMDYAGRLAERAKYLAERETDTIEQGRLWEIARIYSKVPAQPAETLREGLTTVWVCWNAILLENPNVGISLGRLDQILYPLYENDVNRRAPEPREAVFKDAIELLCHFWLKLGDHVPIMTETAEQLFGGTGANQAVTIGGVDKDGEDAVNELTYAMLKAIELMQLRDPNLNARYHTDKNTRDYLNRLCEVNIKTGATPAIHNDKAIIEALRTKGDLSPHGDPLQWARDYGIVGCVEPGSNGRHYAHSAAILLNLPAALELTVYSGKHRRTGLGESDPQIGPRTADPAGFSSFAEFMDAFEKQTLWLVDRATQLNNNLGKTHQDYYPTPILSTFFEGPMQKGKDLIQGGALINSSGVAIIGLADVADSLTAIQHWVFGEERLSFSDMRAALNSDFARTETYYDKIDRMDKSHEALQKMLSDCARTPKFGNDNQMADDNARYLVRLLDQAFAQRQNYRGGKYRVGYWTMTIHCAFGKLTEALPSGRKAWENFASGITPVSKVTFELTDALKSVASLPAAALSSGVALNIKFTPPDVENDTAYRDRFAAVVETYFGKTDPPQLGGVEIQFNVIDHETFLNVAKEPQNYPDLAERLLVRVSGYTAYFKDLNCRMQKEIIDRTEYVLSTERMRDLAPFPLSDCASQDDD